MGKLDGRRVVFLVADLTHDEELNFPKYWVSWEGAQTVLAGIQREHESKFGRRIKADIITSELTKQEFDAVVIPGGFGPDQLRTDHYATEFVKKMDASRKLVASICHGAQVLISAGVVKGRRLTCVKQVADDVINAGGLYEDKPIIIDGNLITSRLPMDLPPFTSAVIEKLQKPVEAKIPTIQARN